MKRSIHILTILAVVALCLLTGCLPPEPYSNSKQDIVVEKQIVGSWIGKSHTAEIEMVDAETYGIYFELHSDFIEQSMDFKIAAEGNLYRYEDHLIGQFKTSSFKIGSETKGPAYKEMDELINRYIIGLVETVDEQSFNFYWLPAEVFGHDKQVTTPIIQAKLPELIQKGEYKKGAISFTRLTENFTAEQFRARERAKYQEAKKYCLDIVSGEIPIQSVIDKYYITTEELSCLAGAIDKQKDLDMETLSELLELNLPVRGFVSIMSHENSTIETKRKAAHKVLFSDRKNFEGAHPLAAERDGRNRIIAYHPVITEKLLHDNVLLLEAKPEWYNNKECIDFVFNLARIGITSPATIEYIVGKIREVLTMYANGEKSLFAEQKEMIYLLRDYYFHENMTAATRNKLLNFYQGEVDTEKKKGLIALLDGVLINEICTVYWVKDEDVIDLMRFVVEKNRHGAGIGYVNGVPYNTGGSYFNNLPYSGIDFARVIKKNNLPIEILVELAKQNPYTIRYSLPMINDSKDVSDIKASLEQMIKSLQLEYDTLTKATGLDYFQKRNMYSIRDAIKSYSSLLPEIEQKIAGP